MGNFSIGKKKVEGHTTYHLRDGKRKMEFKLVPDIGNWGYSLKADGKEVFYAPVSLEQYIKDRGLGSGNPLMAPFANRIDKDYYYFEDRKYLLNADLGNFLRTSPTNFPIHGLLSYDKRWEVVKTSASDSTGAAITSRMDFYKYPDLMAQFPFAHIHEVTYRLKGGKLECATKITNVGNSNMPIHFGYHPYFVPDGPREQWTLHVAARQHWIVPPELIPSGELEPAEKCLPGCTGTLTLGNTFIDAGFTDLVRDKDGLARFWAAGASTKLEVAFGPEFTTAVCYAPLQWPYICIEPQTGPTNAFNLKHEGKIADLRVLAPGKIFQGSYWFIPTGY
jgi:aldose 1-epimerase